MAELPETPMPTVDAIWAAREREAEGKPQYDGYGVPASALGSSCDRQLWYGLRWASPHEKLTGRKLRVFERGNIEEERVIWDLRRAGVDVLAVDDDTGRQWTFAMARGLLRGRADGVITGGVVEAPKARHVLEIKTLKAADWRAIRKHGLLKAKPEHWHQLHTGMAGLNIARGLYVGVNKDTEEILTERIRLDAAEAARQAARVERIAGSDDPPGRVADKPDAFACRFCNHAAICHGGAFARRNCRTCLHFAFRDDGNGHCARFDQPLRPADQGDGRNCPAHLYLPGLVAGEQVDADAEAETVTYRMPNETLWTDGAKEAPAP